MSKVNAAISPKISIKSSMIALAVALSSTTAFAEESASSADAAADASTILVVGQKDAPITVVPRGLSVSLGQEEFDAVNALNVEDLMKYAPNFFVRKRFAGDDNAVVALRGANTIQSARTIVMVDGFGAAPSRLCELKWAGLRVSKIGPSAVNLPVTLNTLITLTARWRSAIQPCQRCRM